MPLEEATYIHELNSAYPLGTGEPKSLGDDHLRLIKSTIQATFPNVAGAVTASHTQLSTLNEGTLPACNGSQLTNLNGSEVKSGTVADARLSGNVALLDRVGQTFSTRQTFAGVQSGENGAIVIEPSNGNNAQIVFSNTGNGTDEKRFRLRYGSATLRFDAAPDTGASSGGIFMDVRRSGTTVTSLAFAATAITLNGVDITDYARLSQQNVFGTATASISERMAIGAAGVTRFTLQNTDDDVTTMLLAETSEGVVGTLTAHPLELRTGNTVRVRIAANSGEITTANASAAEFGYKGVPVAGVASSRNTADGDEGKTLYISGNSVTVTIVDSEHPIGTAITFIGAASGGGSSSIAISGGTLYLAGTGWATTGTRTLAYGGMATVVKLAADVWLISGTGLS